MIINFKAKIYCVGDSYVITIPKDFVKQNLLSKGCEYQFGVKIDNYDKANEEFEAWKKNANLTIAAEDKKEEGGRKNDESI